MRSFIVSLAVLGTGMLAWPTAAATNIRVLVASGSAVSVRVPIAASVAQSGPATGLTAPALSGSYSWTVTPGASGGLSLNGQEAGSDTLYLPPVPGSTVEIAGRTYRGGLLLKAAKGGVSAVNVLDLEDYLRGVVPAEMPSGWPLEALKSQAVVARTYAAARINPGSYYDLCATDQLPGVRRRGARGDRQRRRHRRDARAGRVVRGRGRQDVLLQRLGPG